MSSSELLSIAAVLLANCRKGCVWPGTSTHLSHPRQVVKWTTDDDRAAGSRCGGRRTWLAVAGRQVGIGGIVGGDGEWKGQVEWATASGS
jgi:hypothetical protein